jgi:hypothetical protein
MNTYQLQWEQQTNPRIRVRSDGDYWVIAEPATWEMDDSCDHAARIYYGTFPIRVAEIGFVWGDTRELALENAIEHLERRLADREAQPYPSLGNGTWASGAAVQREAGAAGRQFAEEWRF